MKSRLNRYLRYLRDGFEVQKKMLAQKYELKKQEVKQMVSQNPVLMEQYIRQVVNRKHGFMKQQVKQVVTASGIYSNIPCKLIYPFFSRYRMSSKSTRSVL